MAATQLGIYNHALRILGERPLASLSEASEPRRVLDDIWDRDGIIKGAAIYCLEHGLWGFATRSAAISYSPSVEPPFGFVRAFDKPDDWVRTAGVCVDSSFKSPLADTGYADEAGFWFADPDIIYVKYISKDLSYGLDMSLWPGTFTDFLATYKAFSACKRITKKEPKAIGLDEDWKIALRKAKGIDGTNKPTATRPLGQWARARFAGRSPENG